MEVCDDTMVMLHLVCECRVNNTKLSSEQVEVIVAGLISQSD